MQEALSHLLAKRTARNINPYLMRSLLMKSGRSGKVLVSDWLSVIKERWLAATSRLQMIFECRLVVMCSSIYSRSHFPRSLHSPTFPCGILRNPRTGLGILGSRRWWKCHINPLYKSWSIPSLFLVHSQSYWNNQEWTRNRPGFVRWCPIPFHGCSVII